ncbi:MAG: hypothetical protein OIF48_18515, partial [Silicimonas sp.]|nr:hypothetical protein [Silicimonas sp.]
MRFWIWLGELPLRFFGVATGLSIYAADKRYQQVKLEAEFDETKRDERKRLRRELLLAWFRVLAFWVGVLLFIRLLTG